MLNTYLKQKGQQVVAVCDITKENLDRAAESVAKAQGKAPDTYGDGPDAFKTMLERKDIHAIVTATPCFEHARITHACIMAGKHVYTEKPLALTVADADQVVATAKANPKVVVQVGFQWMASPRFRETIERVHRGEIGELVEGRFFRHNGNFMKGWFSKREKSGDWMLEQACHEYNIMNWVAGTTPLRAFGMGRRGMFQDQDPGRDVTDYYAAIIEYPNNFVVHYAHSWGSPAGFRGEFAQKAIGTKGAVEIGGNNIASSVANHKIEPLSAPQGDDTEFALQAFLTSVREGKPSVGPVEYGRNASLLGLLVRKAVDERRLVTWEEMLRTC